MYTCGSPFPSVASALLCFWSTEQPPATTGQAKALACLLLECIKPELPHIKHQTVLATNVNFLALWLKGVANRPLKKLESLIIPDCNAGVCMTAWQVT